MYLLVMREDESHEWEPFQYFIEDLAEAQRKIVNVSRGSRYHYDIWDCQSITNRMCKDEDCVEPTIVKERG